MSRSTDQSEDLPLIGKRGVHLPAWAAGGIILAIISVVALAAESRAELGHQRAEIAKLESRIDKLEERTAKAVEGIRDSLGKVQLSLARICQQVNAECLGEGVSFERKN